MTANAPIGIVAGSGINLEGVLDSHHDVVSFTQLPGLPPTAVSGHTGTFTHGICGDQPVILQSGRLHFYEGHPYETVVKTVDYMHDQGVRTVIYTNAAGGLVDTMRSGDLMAVESIALWPYTHWADAPDEIKMDFVLDGCDFTGIYTCMHGPCYETQAEIRALQSRKSHVVGMSTAPEVLRCHKKGMRAGSISCITNNCCAPIHLTHEHVVATAQQASQRITEIIRQALPGLHR
ncbi:MAG: hypothetical protein COA73_07275 [Candidatus Hydrogenedentota bacterium]|nr:MAG: hypothetical protein COA73_07275 [Candidatus Hydrogenedentota bacterium]